MSTSSRCGPRWAAGNASTAAGPGGPSTRTNSGARSTDESTRYVAFIRAFAPDFHNEVVLSITEDATTFARLSCRGTHRGEVFGIRPTGRRFEYAGAAVFTVRDELISDVWVLGDIYGLLQQLEGQDPVR